MKTLYELVQRFLLRQKLGISAHHPRFSMQFLKA